LGEKRLDSVIAEIVDQNDLLHEARGTALEHAGHTPANTHTFFILFNRNIPVLPSRSTTGFFTLKRFVLLIRVSYPDRICIDFNLPDPEPREKVRYAKEVKWLIGSFDAHF